MQLAFPVSRSARLAPTVHHLRGELWELVIVLYLVGLECGDLESVWRTYNNVQNQAFKVASANELFRL